MESILQEILTEVKGTRGEVQEINQRITKLEKDFAILQKEVSSIRKELIVLQKEVSSIRKDLTVLQEQVSIMDKELNGLRGKFEEFKKEVETHFEKLTKEIGKEINLLAEATSIKMTKIRYSLKKETDLNKKEHKVFEAQISQIKTKEEYLESKWKAEIA